MDAHLLLLACNLYNTSPDKLIPLLGGHYNDVYLFPLQQPSQVLETSEVSEDDKYGILRIGLEDCPINQTLGMLDWVNYLSRQGAPVTVPLLSVNNHLLESLMHYGRRYTITAFEKAKGTLAENIPTTEWSADLFKSIGKAVGKLHKFSTSYQPSHNYLTRPYWFDAYEIHEAKDKLAPTTDPAREKLASLIDDLQKLPTSTIDFGLIHGDLHFANFLIQPEGSVTIIDFDDCVYGWFAMDIAMALFDALVLFNATSEIESQRFARNFLSNYLSGYRREKELPIFWQNQIPQFLKLKELCIYASLIGHQDIERPDTWVGRFMLDRSTRIANDMPYVDIEFGSL